MEAFASYGAHYLTRADWGCMNGTHAGWIIVEAQDDADARRMLPPSLRDTARLVQVNKFNAEQIMEMRRQLRER